VPWQDDARDIFLRKHLTQRKERWVTGNFLYFRMHRIVDIYFVGGFGTVQWIDPAEYTSCQPDTIVLNDPHTTLQVSQAPAHRWYRGRPSMWHTMLRWVALH
jgi:nitrate reductase NapE component